MLDIKFVRENAEAVKTAMANRNADVDVDRVVQLHERRRAIVSEVETLKAERNRISKSISQEIEREHA